MKRHVIRSRMVWFVLPPALIFGVVAIAFLDIRHQVASRTAHFNVPIDANDQQLHRIIRRVHQGQQIDDWQIPKTLATLDQVLSRLEQAGRNESEIARETQRYRLYYQLEAMRRQLIECDAQTLRDCGDKLRAWAERGDLAGSDFFGCIVIYVQLLQWVDVPTQQSIDWLQAIETAIGQDTDLTAEQRDQVFATLSSIGRRHRLLGTIPRIVGQDLAGDTIDLEDYRGKFVLLEVWSTRCKPCLAEISDLKRIRDQYSRADFEIIGLPLDPYPGRVLEVIETQNVDWPQIWSPAENRRRMRDMGFSAIPSSVLIDQDGKVVDFDLRPGSQSSERNLESVLADRLRSKAARLSKAISK